MSDDAPYASPRTIEAGFAGLGLTPRQAGYRCWDVSTSFTDTAGMSARLEGGWLLLDMPCNGTGRDRPERDLLAWNGLLAGGAKFALAPSDRTVRVRAEIPFEDDPDLHALLAEALEGFRQAQQVLREGSISAPAPDGPAAPPSASRSEPAGARLADLATEVGWPFVTRSSERLAVELDGGRTFHQAILEEYSGGAIRATVELVSWDSASPESSAALAVLLLATGGLVRLARPVLEDSGAGVGARFEVRSSALRTPAWLGRALSALSVACRLCGREAAVLADAGIARDYLALRGLGVHRPETGAPPPEREAAPQHPPAAAFRHPAGGGLEHTERNASNGKA